MIRAPRNASNVRPLFRPPGQGSARMTAWPSTSVSSNALSTGIAITTSAPTADTNCTSGATASDNQLTIAILRWRPACELSRSDRYPGGWRELSAPEGVSDRQSVTRGPGGRELHVVANQVEMRFWPDKEVSVGIEPQAGPEVSHEMLAADKICAADKITIDHVLVEADILDADAGGQFRFDKLAQVRRVK